MSEGGAYDASEVDERQRSSHLSRKDVRVLAVVGVFLIILMTPVYCMLKIQRDQHLCKQNMSQIFKAVSLYATENNDRYPPAFVTDENREPQLFTAAGSTGEGAKHVYSWMSLVQPHLNVRASFECPAASAEEHVSNLSFDPDKPPFNSDYGMYIPWSAWATQMVSNPDRSVLFGETSNHGAEDTLDPSPFTHGHDGIVIGWESGNLKPGSADEFVTRLAFPETSKKNFSKEGRTRHAGSSLFINANGSLLYLKPDAARIQWMDSSKTEIIGRWATR